MPSPKRSRNRSSNSPKCARFQAMSRGDVLTDGAKEVADKTGWRPVARPIFPPARQTRKSSLAAFSWLGVNITPTVDRTTSKEYQ